MKTFLKNFSTIIIIRIVLIAITLFSAGMLILSLVLKDRLMIGWWFMTWFVSTISMTISLNHNLFFKHDGNSKTNNKPRK